MNFQNGGKFLTLLTFGCPSNNVYNSQARRQDFAAGGAKNHKVGHIF